MTDPVRWLTPLQTRVLKVLAEGGEAHGGTMRGILGNAYSQTACTGALGVLALAGFVQRNERTRAYFATEAGKLRATQKNAPKKVAPRRKNPLYRAP